MYFRRPSLALCGRVERETMRIFQRRKIRNQDGLRRCFRSGFQLRSSDGHQNGRRFEIHFRQRPVAEMRFVGARKHENRPEFRRESLSLVRFRLAGTETVTARTGAGASDVYPAGHFEADRADFVFHNAVSDLLMTAAKAFLEKGKGCGILQKFIGKGT